MPSWRGILKDPRWALGRSLLFGALIGVATGFLTVGFREAYSLIADVLLSAGRETTPDPQYRWLLFVVPCSGGLAVGILTRLFFGRNAGIPGVADVVLAQTRDRGLMGGLDAIKAGALNILALGTGASVGREGPLVHLGGTLGSLAGTWARLDDTSRRVYVACGVAAAVAASFNAPLAGLFFAIEIALGGLTSLSLAALGPVVLSAIAGTLVSREILGVEAAFKVSAGLPFSVWEFPAFLLLGLVCALFSIVFLRLVKAGWRLRRDMNARLPSWTHPALAGTGLGLLALWMPEVLGPGHEATDQALQGLMNLETIITLLALKTLAVLLCLILGYGSGVFFPSLMIGALLGVFFGQIAIYAAPGFPADVEAYGLAGMGAMVGAILGAPLSTILMVFELTGNYQVTIAVMLAVIVAAQVTHAVIGNTFFGLQLEQRGVRLVLGG